jgi:hypothetical protein
MTSHLGTLQKQRKIQQQKEKKEEVQATSTSTNNWLISCGVRTNRAITELSVVTDTCYFCQSASIPLLT